MQIRVSKTVHESVNISDAEVKKIVHEKLNSMLVRGEYLKQHEGATWVCEDDYRYHGTPSTEYLRVATTLDLAIFLVLGAL